MLIALLALFVQNSGYVQQNPGGPGVGWPKWCEEQLAQADKTLIVASPGWFTAYENTATPGAGLGAACEAGLVRQMLYDGGGHNERFRLVFLEPMAADAVPTGLRRWHQFHIYKGAAEFDALVAWLQGTPAAPASPLIPTPATGPVAAALPRLPRDLLAFLAENYPDVRDARSLWQRAGGRAAEVENISRPFDLWQALWRRSLNGAAAQPQALLREVQQDYPSNPVVVHYLSML